MIEKVTMKEAEGALNKVNELEYVRGLDKDGNPISINKEDLATVLGGLLPIADKDKNGLMESSLYKNISKSVTIAGGSLYKILDLENLVWIRHGFRILMASETGLITEYINCTTYSSETGKMNIHNYRRWSGINIKIYQKQRSIYIYTNWNIGTNYIAFIDSCYPIEHAGDLDDTYIEVPIIDLDI